MERFLSVLTHTSLKLLNTNNILLIASSTNEYKAVFETVWPVLLNSFRLSSAITQILDILKAGKLLALLQSLLTLAVLPASIESSDSGLISKLQTFYSQL